MSQIERLFKVESLSTPVPDMTAYRRKKASYRSVPINKNSNIFAEPLVPLSDYSVSSQSYYSRPNDALSHPVDGVGKEVYVRRSIAETLREINTVLSLDAVSDFFGGEVELAVDEGYRSPQLQRYLYESVIPDLIRHELEASGNFTGSLEEAIARERDDKIARPPLSEKDTPSPHATGAAVDLNIRFKQPTLDYVPGVNVPMGRDNTEMTTLTNPDHFEKQVPVNDKEREAQRNRRALYAIMSGVAFRSTGMVPNPTEYWHWSRGDQLSTVITDRIYADYGWPAQAFSR